MSNFKEWSLTTISKKKYTSIIPNKEGVFLSPQGKYVCRVLRKGRIKSLAQFTTEEGALDYWVKCYEDKNK